METNKIKVILDTDIGDDIDDAFALALCINSEEIDLLGVTTVFRNSFKRAKIAKKLAKSLKSDVKVYAGVDDPIVQIVKQILPEKILANEKYDDLGKYIPPQYNSHMDNEKIETLHAIDFIIDMANKYEGELVLVPIGPLTNIALAIRKDSSIIKKIKKIVIMGGYIENKYPEWNIYCDPEAARIVYSSGVKLEAVGLDVTLKCTLSNDDINDLRNSRNNTSQLISEMMEKWYEHYQFKVPVMHDGLAVATLLGNYVSFEEKNIQVLLNEGRGSTIEVVEDLPGSSRVNVGMFVKNQEFLTMFKSRVFKSL